MTSVDPQTPANIQEQMDIKRRLLELDSDSFEENAYTTDDTPEPETFHDFEDVKNAIRKPITKRSFKAVLTHELYTVSFPVEDISIADYQLALKIPRNDFKFEPVPQSKFILSVRSKQYPLVYVGGLFDFPSDSTWALTFILDYDDTPPTDKLE